MKKEEIDEFIEDRFKKIDKHFHKAIANFKIEDVLEFRSEIKKLKVFLHLLNMESEDGLSYRITKRMKTIYGYFGVIQNLQLQLKMMNEYVKKSLETIFLGGENRGYKFDVLVKTLKDLKIKNIAC